MTDVVVRSERVVLRDGERPAAIHIRDGAIVAVRAYEATAAGVPTIDAGALPVLPGFVDTHVHINDPGRADWEGADHATRAAAAGGVTTVVDMPLNSIPATTTSAGLAAKRAALDGRCHVDVGFWGGVVPGNAAELAPLAAAGVLGFKCFLSPSGVDEFAHVDETDLAPAVAQLAALRRPLLVHAEMPARLREPDGDPRSYRTWLASRPATAECGAIDLLVGLAGRTGAHIHVVHLSSADAVPLLRAARARGVPISAETCPHYLMFAAEEIPDGATAFKCAPPIRAAADREALWRALEEGTIDLIATDHSPAPAALKHIGDGDFIAAWGGIASLQLGAAVVWTAAVARGLTLNHLAQWLSGGPAKLAGLETTKGMIAPGADADLVVWDPDAAFVVDPAALHHRHPATPYAGVRLTGRAEMTILRGEVISRRGEIVQSLRGRMIGARS